MIRILYILSVVAAVADALSNQPQRQSSSSPALSLSNSVPARPTKARIKVPSAAKLSSSVTTTTTTVVPRRQLSPPFPDGPCGGTVVEIPPEETFGLDVNLGSINLLGDLVLLPRTIRVWLPPGYSDDDNGRQTRHPVLFVHDGQNAMTDSESWTGKSWRLMGALTRLADHGLLFRMDNGEEDTDEAHPTSALSSSSSSPLLPIVVLIPSAEGDLMFLRRRHLEYGDINFPFAQAHADLVAKTIKPLIDNRFRTDPSPEKTFAMGTSMGGNASLHLVLRYPNLFGGAACLSPAFGPQILNKVSNLGMTEQSILKSKRIYIDIGGDHGDVRVPPIDVFDHFSDVHQWNPGYFWLDTQLQDQVMTMKDALSNPSVGANVCFRMYPGGRHNERAWAQRIDKPILHLFS
jgi:pimeloyl-ACP methyl ester carboxylesterase